MVFKTLPEFETTWTKFKYSNKKVTIDGGETVCEHKKKLQAEGCN